MRTIINLGSFIVGEVPSPLEYHYLDSVGVPLNLTGYTITRFQWGAWVGGTPFTNAVTRTASLTDPLDGEVTYAWQGDEFATTGRFAGMFFVNNSVNQFASVLLEWNVCAAAGVPPVV